MLFSLVCNSMKYFKTFNTKTNITLLAHCTNTKVASIVSTSFPFFFRSRKHKMIYLVVSNIITYSVVVDTGNRSRWSSSNFSDVPYFTSKVLTISRLNWIWEIFGFNFFCNIYALFTHTSINKVKIGHNHFFPLMPIL